MPGYLQEDIIILRNKGGVTVSQKRRRRGSDERTQEGQYDKKVCRNKMGRYLSHLSCKKQGTNQRLISIRAKIKIGV